MADYNIQDLKFLIVDDDANMRRLIWTILNSLGVKEAEMAGGAEQGYAKLSKFAADMVICDLRMDPLDGIEFTHMVRMRDDSPNIYLPIIILTGHAEMAAVENARDAGVNEFMTKPVSAQKLFEKIRNIIEKPRAYIRTKDYFGPDRRRRQDPNYKGPQRRRDA